MILVYSEIHATIIIVNFRIISILQKEVIASANGNDAFIKKKVNMDLPYDSAIFILDIYSKELLIIVTQSFWFTQDWHPHIKGPESSHSTCTKLLDLCS
jgi:hypothetical protein